MEGGEAGRGGSRELCRCWLVRGDVAAFQNDPGVSAASGRAVRAVSGTALIASVLLLCLFGECKGARQSGAFGAILSEVGAAASDLGTQWMVFVCASLYFLTFVILRRRLAAAGEELWLREPAYWVVGLIALSALAYTLDYSQAVKSGQALTLIGVAMLGQGAALWEGRRKNAEGRNQFSGTVAGVLIVLLAGAAVWHGEAGHLFEYHGQARWAGPWESPNTFGVLMGAGLVLAVGLLVQSPRSKDQSRPNAEGRKRSLRSRVQRLKSIAQQGLLLAAAGVMGWGLIKSYSRGAWLGAVVGLGLLVVQSSRFKAQGSRLKGQLALGVVIVSLGVLAFWGFRQVERGMVRRAYSAANANDFSWRNRVAAYEGALQMIAERPWFGLGWNQPERMYDQYYRAAKVDEGMAIQMNDYFTLGTTLGVPGLVCFVMYVGLSLRGSPKSKVQSPRSEVQGPTNAGQQPEDG